MFGSAPISQFKLGQTKGRPSEMVSPPRDFQTRGQLLFGGIYWIIIGSGQNTPWKFETFFETEISCIQRKRVRTPHILCRTQSSTRLCCQVFFPELLFFVCENQSNTEYCSQVSCTDIFNRDFNIYRTYRQQNPKHGSKVTLSKVHSHLSHLPCNL